MKQTQRRGEKPGIQVSAPEAEQDTGFQEDILRTVIDVTVVKEQQH
jgi:hypothetical protein